MHTFAAFIVDCQGSGNSTSDITTLGNIAALKANIFHELIKDTRDILGGKVLVQRRTRRKRVSRQRRNDQMKRQGIW